MRVSRSPARSKRAKPCAMSYERKTLEVAVIGAGRMGTHRARMAASHPAVRFLAISDADPARAKALGEQVGAHFTTGSNEEAISHPDVTAVIVSTPEPKHVDPIFADHRARKNP